MQLLVYADGVDIIERNKRDGTVAFNERKSAMNMDKLKFILPTSRTCVIFDPISQPSTMPSTL